MQESYQPERSLGSIMGRVGRAMERAMSDRFRNAGLSLGLEHFIVLIHLGVEDGQSQQQLGEEAGRHKTSVTRAIDWLEKQNMVVRVPDQKDRRHKRVYLTNLGREMIEQLKVHGEEQMREAKKGIDPAEMEVCKKVLLQVYDNLKHYI